MFKLTDVIKNNEILIDTVADDLLPMSHNEYFKWRGGNNLSYKARS